MNIGYKAWLAWSGAKDRNEYCCYPIRAKWSRLITDAFSSRKYFEDPWNKLEVVFLVLAFICVGMYGSKEAYSRYITEKISEEKSNRFIILTACRLQSCIGPIGLEFVPCIWSEPNLGNKKMRGIIYVAERNFNLRIYLHISCYSFDWIWFDIANGPTVQTG